MPGLEVTRDASHPSIVILTLNRPEALNALNDETYTGIATNLNAAAKDESVDVVIITGTGRYFCAGTDLKDGMARMNAGKPTTGWEAPVGRFVDAVLSFPKLLIAAVNGNAVGIGMTLLPHCDAVFLTAHAQLWVPFGRLALVPEFASSLAFHERLGRALATDVLLRGRRLSAPEALVHGLATRVCTDHPVLDEAKAFATEILALPAGAESSVLYKRLASRVEQMREIARVEFAALDARVQARL